MLSNSIMATVLPWFYVSSEVKTGPVGPYSRCDKVNFFGVCGGRWGDVGGYVFKIIQSENIEW